MNKLENYSAESGLEIGKLEKRNEELEREWRWVKQAKEDKERSLKVLRKELDILKSKVRVNRI